MIKRRPIQGFNYTQPKRVFSREFKFGELKPPLVSYVSVQG